MNRNSRLFRLFYIFWLIPLAITVLLLWGGFRAKKTDLLFPRQQFWGIEFGGKTPAEAEAALTEAGFGAGNGFAVTVTYPDGYSFTISAADAGLIQDTEAVLDLLYEYGRSGRLLRDAADWFHSVFRTRILTYEPPELDTAEIYAAAQAAAAETDLSMTPSSLFPSDTELRWTRGVVGQKTDVSELTRLITQAFLLGESSISYEPARLEPEMVDFAALHEKLTYPCKDAYYEKDWALIPEEDGLDFDLEAAEAMAAQADYGETVVVPFIVLHPAVTKADLTKKLYSDLLSSYSTTLIGTDVRQQNIRLAAEALNGYIVNPGSVFSFNEAVGQRTEERGFGAAPAYSGGQVVLEVGGGICQVSSTLYNAVLLADLEITYRTCHRYAQTYVPYGLDATVSWGGPDFQFTNNTGEPLRISTSFVDGKLNIELWGSRQWTGYIEMTYEVIETIPPTEVEQPDPTLPLGKRQVSDWGKDGMIVQTYRNRYTDDGTLIETVPEDESIYASKDKIVLVGTKTY